MSVDVDLEPSVVALDLNYMHKYHGIIRQCVIFQFGRVSIVGSRKGLFCRLDSSINLNASMKWSNIAFECAYYGL